jgi:MinD superfamily P-loop ATPase
MQPDILEEETFKGGKLAYKDDNKCIDCGLCEELCNFGAINSQYQVNDIKCEGCGLCVAKFPTDALTLVPEETGKLYLSGSKVGRMAHAKLKIGAENSGKLVTKVKEKAEEIAQKESKDLLLIDGSPGIGCPVIASLNGVDATLIVTEPTKSGLADLKRVLKVVQHFDIPAMIAINKYDLNLDLTAEIEEFAKKEEISVIGKLPFSKTIVKAMQEGELVVEYASDSEVSLAIREIYNKFRVEN